jgi:hypothetical protein
MILAGTMKRVPLKKWILILTASALAFGACQTTRVSNIHRDPTYDPQTMQRVFVAAVVKAPRVQSMIEDEFVRRLEKQGRQAIASHNQVSRGVTLDRDAWVKMITDNHCDTLILSRLTSSVVENEKDIGAKVNLPDTGSGYGYGYYSYAQTYSPGSYSRDETAFIETKVFDISTQREVWSAQSKSEIVWGRDPEVQVRQFVDQLMRAAKHKTKGQKRPGRSISYRPVTLN